MPNHIVNHLTIKGTEQQVCEVLDFLKGKNGLVDFNNIRPMPECLDIESGSDGERGKGYLLYKKNPNRHPNYKRDYECVESWDDDRKKRAIKLGKQYLENIARYGHDTWYSWSRCNWGTKWNAYDCMLAERIEGCAVVEFQTAWSGVPELMGDVVAKFPNVEFDYLYADEDAGYNVGIGFSSEGQLMMMYPQGDSNNAWDIYFKTHPWAVDEFEYIDGKWMCKS